MKKAFRKSLKRQTSLGYFSGSLRRNTRDDVEQTQYSNGTPILWQALSSKYEFNYPKDWYRIEAHWLDQIESFQERQIDCPGRDTKMNNSITRITQCNESYQVCNSLPRSFIVPRDLDDVTLEKELSTVIKDHRVPIISYCCPIELRRTFIIRCASFDQDAKVVKSMENVVGKLEILNLSAIAPTLDAVESAHRKLKDVCRPGDDQSSNFVSKSGKWLAIVSIALKIVNETARILLNEKSVMLVEEDDRGWNSVVSALVQLILEPHRRTVEGLESLISKEWIYLAGGKLDYTGPDSLFTLFLDCIYQIYLQNVSKFEFTSEYLRYLFEAQYISLPTSSSPNISSNNTVSFSNQQANGPMSKNKTTFHTKDEDEDIIGNGPASYRPSSFSLVDLNNSLVNNNNNPSPGESLKPAQQLERGYDMFMFSPFYKPDKNSPSVEVYDHIANMKLWSSLYLRWQPAISYGCIEESFYFS